MAALTQSAIDALLGVLATAIQNEARLIGGVHSDMKFIKDEMDSMNGFLMHLNNMESEHDDQIRAWMKQVREVSYVAEDCVDRYVRVVDRYGAVWGGGCVGTLAFSLAHPNASCQLHKLGNQIAELKARVQDVGARRKRYDVSVPTDRGLMVVQSKLPDQVEEKREAFVHTLEKDVVGTPAWFRSTPVPDPDPGKEKLGALLLEDALVHQLPADSDTGPGTHTGHGPGTDTGLGGPSSGHGVGNGRQLPDDTIGRSEADKRSMRAILVKCCPPLHKAKAADVDPDEAAAFRCTRSMFLCAMYVYPPYLTTRELEKLEKGVTAHGVGAQEARKKVMVFCYSLLSTQQKSCLQYVTAFLHEKEISRTSMVRRWVAEGLVGKEPAGGGGSSTSTTPEEAGERCFGELLLRGFVRAARWSDAGTVKSCVMDGPIRDFIEGITKSENFIAELPAHLKSQLKIRSIVQRRASMPSQPQVLFPRCNLRCCGGGCTWLVGASSEDSATAKDPMDELVGFIRGLPELYRLNVLDLGGCRGLRTRHLKSFAEVECLKYLSLRNTDVSRLNTTHINKLTLLETLDIRDTNIRPRDTVSIYLPRLKHLLAGRFIKATTMPAVEKASLVTVRMPDRIGSMELMETLSHVEVSMDGAELQGVAKLHQLRKLGVVVHANATTAALLGRVLYMLAGNLRSLSVWVAIAVPHTTITTQQGGGTGTGTGILDVPSMYEMDSNLALENLDIKGKMSLPSWIGRASKLVNVTLRDTEMDGGDALRRLATVQSLRCLKISRKAFAEQALRFKDVQFQALKFLVIEGDALTRITFFANDAAPKLEKIVWVIGGGSKIAQMYNEDLIIGIDNLTCLQKIELRASFKLTTLSEWTKQKDTTENPTYRIRYISSYDGQLITELPRTATHHTTLSLPAGVIN